MIVVSLGRGPKIEPEVDRSLQKLSDRDRNIFTHNYLYVTISSFNIIFENKQLINTTRKTISFRFKVPFFYTILKFLLQSFFQFSES